MLIFVLFFISICLKETTENDKQLKHRKAYSYYSIVQADGDKMGEYIQTYADDLQGFSRKCVLYCLAASKLVDSYGGMTIYAGGDDLLFIAPVISTRDGETDLLTLLRQIKDLFMSGEFFGDKEIKPTVSFGAALCFYKHPLYEAFDEAYQLLFYKAKKSRDALAVSLIKHSGQAVRFVIDGFSCNPVTKSICDFISMHSDEKFLKSISVHIWNFKALFAQAIKAYYEHPVETNITQIQNIFQNTFDSGAHKEDKNLAEIEQTRSLLMEILIPAPKAEDKALTRLHAILPDGQDEVKSEEIPLYALDAVLRYVKFYAETGEESERNQDDTD